MTDCVVVSGIGMIGPGAFGRAAVVAAFPELPETGEIGRAHV